MRFFVLFGLASLALAASLKHKFQRDLTIIPDEYIVKFKGDVSILAEKNLKSSIKSRVIREYSMSTFRGFAGTLTAEQKADFEASSLVEYIEPNAVMYANSFTKQNNATWGLARISSRTPGGTTYTYDTTAGQGTCAYVIDTGITLKHPDFEGRAEFLIDTSGENSTTDGAGHGTHVAGTIGSKTYGVAKKTKLIAVKVLDSDGRGTTADIIAGFQAVANDAKKRASQCKKGLVANISLGGPSSKSINDAAKAITQAGIFVAVAAGNAGTDARAHSPASEPSVCTVGATIQNDTIAFFTNYGPIVDVYAPGWQVTSLWNNGSIATVSGTSMASPHVAGLGAYLLGLGLAEVGKVCEKIRELATKDVIGELPEDTDNLLAFNGATTGLYKTRPMGR